MPSIKDETTIEALARAFVNNGRNQEKAMIEVGYSKAYARSYCGQLWANPKIKAAIRKIDAEIAAKLDVNRDYLIKETVSILRTSTNEKNKLQALSLLGDFTGSKRENAPNAEREAARRAKMSHEQRKMAEIGAKLRTDEESSEPRTIPIRAKTA